MHWATDTWRRLVAALAFGVAAIVTGCGGGGSGTAEPEPDPEGTGVLAGASATLGAQVTVRGATGLGRIVPAREDASFKASLFRLGAPYVINAPIFDEATGTMLDLYAWSADGQGVSVNPLSTLQLAVLARQDPKAVYGAVSQWAGVSFGAAQVAAAEDEVAAYLQQYLAVPVPAGVRGFATRTWKAGDGSAFETVANALLQAALARGEDLGLLAARLGRRTAACARQSAPVTVDGVARRFCPGTVSRGPDPDDAALQLLRLDGDEDGVLDVRLRGGAVVSVLQALPDGRRFGCSDGGCAGAALQGGQTLVLALALPSLDGAGTGTRFDGRLSVPAGSATVLPPAECRSNVVAIGGSGRAAQAECATSDDFGQGATFSGQRGASPRRYVDFSLSTTSRQLQVSLQGTRVDAVVLSEFDPEAGRTRYFACTGAGCAGTEVAEPVADPLDVGWQIQALRLDGTVLARVRDDGSLDDGDVRTLDARLQLIIDPAVSPQDPSDCSGRGGVAVAIDEDARAYAICPPTDDPFAATLFPDPDGVTRQAFARGDFFESVTVFIDPSDRVLRAVFEDPNNGQRFGCGRTAAGEPACTGITLSAEGEDGSRTLSFDGTTMAEQVMGQVVGTERRARLSGQVRLGPTPS